MVEVYDYSAGRLMPDNDWLINESVNKANRTVNGRALTPAEQLAKHQQQVQKQNYMNQVQRQKYMNTADTGLAGQAANVPAYSMVDAVRDRDIAVNADYDNQLSDFDAVPKQNVGTSKTVPAKVVKAAPAAIVQKQPAKAVNVRPTVGSGQAAMDDGYIPAQDANDMKQMAAMREAYAAQQAATQQAAAPVAPTGLAAKAAGNGLDESVAYWLNGDANGQAPEGYIPTARYNSFSDMFK